MSVEALEELKVIIEAQTRGFREEMQRVQNQVTRATSNINKQTDSIKNAFKGIVKVVAGLQIAKYVKDSVTQAMQVEGALQQIKRTMGESSQAFLKWGKDQGLAFNLAQADVAKYGAVYSNLLSGFMGGTQNTMKYTEELLKASSIIASGTGRTMDDVMERIRSGMLGNTEAIEDLGINVNVAMLQSTDAFKRFAGSKSWDQLDYKTQQQIRLFAILEQTSTKFGDSVMSNTNSSLQNLVAILKDVGLNIGNAFLPILNIVLPLLSNLALSLRSATAYIAQFMQVLFGKPKSNPGESIKNAGAAAVGAAGATNDYNTALANTGDTAKKTAKEVNRLLGGFDEINTLNNSGADGGGLPGAGLGGNVPGIEVPSVEEPDVSGVARAAEKVKNIIRGIVGFIQTNKEIIISVMAGIAAGIGSFLVMSNWSKIIEGIQLAFYALGYAIGSISWPIVAIAALIALIVGNIVYLWQTNEAFRDSIMQIWTSICDFLKTIVNDTWQIIKDIWDKYGQTLIDNIAGFMQSIQMLIVTYWESYFKPIIEGALEMLTWLWDKHLKALVEQVGEFIMKLVNGALELWNKFFAPIINFLVAYFGPSWSNIVTFIIDILGTFIAYIIDMCSSIFRVLGGIIDFVVGVFTGNWAKAWQGVKDIFGGIFDALVGAAKTPLNWIIDLVNAAIRGINNMIKTINKVPGISIPSVPNIPKLAKGGIVDSATIAMVGEAGKEAVMPLENNTGWITDLAQKVSSRMPQGSSSSSNDNSTLSGDIIFQIDGSVIGKVALAQLRKMQRQGGITLIPV